MTDRWPNVRLGEVLALSPEPHNVVADAEYPNVGMYSYARGLFLKRPIAGSATSAKVLFRVKKDQFIYSRLFAFEGAYGVVPAEFDGAFVSNEYPTFDVDRSRLLPPFLELYFKQPTVWEAVAMASTGVGHRRQRVPPSGVLSTTIPLPPLSDQQSAVSRVEAIAGKVEEARRLRGEGNAGADDLMIAMAHRRDLPDDVKQARGWARRKLGECMQLSEEPVKVAVSESYPNLGIYSFGRGLFAKAPINGFETSASRLFRVKTSQFIYSRLFAFEGAYGVVGEEFDGCFVSNEYPTFDCRPDVMRPEFLAAYFQTPTVWRAVATGSKGLGDRRKRVHPDQVLNHELWLPPLADQDTLAKVSRQRVSSRLPADECSVAMDAVLPAVLDKAFRGEM